MDFLRSRVKIEVDDTKVKSQLAKTKSNFTKTIDKMKKSVGSLSGRFKAAFTKMVRVAKWGALAMAGALVLVAKAAMKQEDVEKRLAITLKATGEAAGFSAGELLKQAEALQEVTRFGDETITAMQTMLLTFKNIKGDEFKRATEAALDMATAEAAVSGRAIDLTAVSIRLGKALNDPVLGMSALSKVGVAFTEQQKEMVKQMVEVGDVAGAQQLILKELEGQFGGMSRDVDTASGALAQMWNGLSDVAEVIGNALLPYIKESAKSIKDWAKNNQAAIGEWAKDTWTKVSEVMDKFVEFGKYLIKHKDYVIAVVGAYAGFAILGTINIAVGVLTTSIHLLSISFGGLAIAGGAVNLGFAAFMGVGTKLIGITSALTRSAVTLTGAVLGVASSWAILIAYTAASIAIMYGAYKAGRILGDYLQKRFKFVAKAGVYLASSLLITWESIRYGFVQAIEGIKWVWNKFIGFIKRGISEVLIVVADMLGDLEKVLSILGVKKDLGYTSLMKTAMDFRKAAEESVNSAAFKKNTEEHKRRLEVLKDSILVAFQEIEEKFSGVSLEPIVKKAIKQVEDVKEAWANWDAEAERRMLRLTGENAPVPSLPQAELDTYIKEWTDATTKINDSIAQMTKSSYDYKMMLLNQEIVKYRAAAVEETLITQYKNARIMELNKEAAEEEKDKAEQFTVDKLNAYKSLYQDMSKLGTEGLAYSIKLLDMERKEYEELIQDKVLLDKWEAEQKQMLLDEHVGGYAQYVTKLREDIQNWSTFVNDRFGDVAQSSESHMSNMFMNMTKDGLEWKNSIQGFFIDVLGSYRKMLSEMLSRQMMSGFTESMATGFLGSIFGELFGPSGKGALATAPVQPAGQTVFAYPGMGHQGGRVGSLPRTRNVPSELFANAPRYHGLRPGEHAIIGEEGETISKGNQAPNVNVNLVNESNTRLQVEQRDVVQEGEDQIVTLVLKNYDEGGRMYDLLKNR